MVYLFAILSCMLLPWTSDAFTVKERGGADAEVNNCFNENAQYLQGCLRWTVKDVHSALGKPDKLHIDVDIMNCALYKVIGNCFRKRATEKCGDKAVKKADEAFSGMAVQLQDACSAQSSISFFSNWEPPLGCN